ncbi:hypothetical protein [Sphingomonas sp. Sph1(2015)]|uniref:hypothetical protein n=1 Tax=Sphingomonas sp. Sph1(2015) TaxID=1628084 RepID=UPI001F5210B9|nr:hypothetical protein [Sphingomonas sp. Sph1(2015)]
MTWISGGAAQPDAAMIDRKVDPAHGLCQSHDMQPDIRAIIAASSHALVTGRKVAGLYDQTLDRHRRIAAEARGEHLQGLDGDRNVKFGGSLPELRETGTGAAIYMEVADGMTKGFDRSSAGHFTCRIEDQVVQLYDHADSAWFTFVVQAVE